MRTLPSALALVCIAAASACTERPADTASTEITLPVLVSSRTPQHFGTVMDGAEEVPSNASQGRGTALLTLNPDGSALSYRLIVANIEGVTQAHIHLGAAGTNGPVVAFLYGFNPAGVTLSGILAEGELTRANLIPRPAAGFGGTVADLVARLRAGNAYVNVHTLALPPGEIRGQIGARGHAH